MNLCEQCDPLILDAKSAPLFELNCDTPYIGKCFKTYDGDTCRFMIKLPNGISAFKARLLHINTAEMRTKCPIEKKIAKEAKVVAKALLDDQICLIHVKGTDLYGRKLCEIQFEDGSFYHDKIIHECLALPYEGTKKFGNILLTPGDTYCVGCNTSDTARKNCLMWQQLTEARELYISN